MAFHFPLQQIPVAELNSVVLPFDFCIPVSILKFTCIFTSFPRCIVTPLLDMTLDDLHIFTWI